MSGITTVRLFRRRLLAGALVAAAASACARPAERTQPTSPAGDMPERARWDQEARGMLADALETLRTFEVFVAFRVGNAADATQLAWDPPTASAWNEATHVARGLHGRAEQLLLQVSTSQVDPAYWRQRREFAEATNDLLELGQALTAYRTRIDFLAPGGDGSAAWDVLDNAWARFDAAASHWGVSRAEPVACAS